MFLDIRYTVTASSLQSHHWIASCEKEAECVSLPTPVCHQASRCASTRLHMETGASRHQAKHLGSSEHQGAPEVRCAGPPTSGPGTYHPLELLPCR